MPKEKEILKVIPAIYKKNAEDIALFFWVQAQQNILPTITVEKAIIKYFNFIGTDWDMECAQTTYMRLKKEFLNVNK